MTGANAQSQPVPHLDKVEACGGSRICLRFPSPSVRITRLHDLTLPILIISYHISTLPFFFLLFLTLTFVVVYLRHILFYSSRMSSPQEQAIAFKNDGNKAFAAHDWATAIDLYTKAIELDDTVATYYSNRAQVRPPYEKKVLSARVTDFHRQISNQKHTATQLLMPLARSRLIPTLSR